MGAPGVNPQLSSKQSMVNSLPPFPTDIKNASVTNVPNMVGCPWPSGCGLWWVCWSVAAGHVSWVRGRETLLGSTVSLSAFLC